MISCRPPRRRRSTGVHQITRFGECSDTEKRFRSSGGLVRIGFVRASGCLSSLVFPRRSCLRLAELICGLHSAG